MKTKYTVVLGAAAALLILLAGFSLAGEFKAASVAEIQSVAADSKCAKKLLRDANRFGQEITRRDLKHVKDQCVSIDQQSKAFE